jgi:hypothetical protein
MYNIDLPFSGVLMSKKFWAGVVFLALSMNATAFGQETKKFDMYGFLDMTLTKRTYAALSMHEMNGLSENLQVRLDHVNLYFDYTPSTKTHALVEFRYINKSSLETEKMGSMISTYINNRKVKDSTASTYIAPKVPRYVDDATGIDVLWSIFSIERAYMEYTLNKYFNIRAGKFLTPAGVWNEDHGSPVITTVFQPYEWSFFPIFPTTQLGLCEKGGTYFGDIGLNWSFYLSSGRMGNDIKKLNDIGVGGNVKVSLPLLKGLDIGLSGFNGRYRIPRKTIWTDVMITPSQFGPPTVKTGFDYMHYVEDYTVNSKEFCSGADVQFFPIKNLKLQWEINTLRMRNDNKGNAAFPTEYQGKGSLYNWGSRGDKYSMITGTYLLGSYKFRIKPFLSITPYYCWEDIQATDAQNNPHTVFGNYGAALKGFVSHIMGINVNLFTYSTIKFEYTLQDAYMQGMMRPYPGIFDQKICSIQFALAF